MQVFEDDVYDVMYAAALFYMHLWLFQAGVRNKRLKKKGLFQTNQKHSHNGSSTLQGK